MGEEVYYYKASSVRVPEPGAIASSGTIRGYAPETESHTHPQPEAAHTRRLQNHPGT